MTNQQARELDAMTARLIETLMTASICAQELRRRITDDIDGREGGQPHRPPSNDVPGTVAMRPLIDDSTLSVVWRGRSVHLGRTRAFDVLRRLARCPNQYVTHLDLAYDVWEDADVPIATLRSTVRHLRTRLATGGMRDLASAIRGRDGRYVLNV